VLKLRAGLVEHFAERQGDRLQMRGESREFGRGKQENRRVNIILDFPK
jgi:hypothetical protein